MGKPHDMSNYGLLLYNRCDWHMNRVTRNKDDDFGHHSSPVHIFHLSFQSLDQCQQKMPSTLPLNLLKFSVFTLFHKPAVDCSP